MKKTILINKLLDTLKAADQVGTKVVICGTFGDGQLLLEALYRQFAVNQYDGEVDLLSPEQLKAFFNAQFVHGAPVITIIAHNGNLTNFIHGLNKGLDYPSYCDLTAIVVDDMDCVKHSTMHIIESFRRMSNELEVPIFIGLCEEPPK